jgi:glutathione S-transferase
MMELYHNGSSTCSAKARMALAEKGAEWKGRHVDLTRGESRTAEYLRLNPNGVVPTLVVDGRTLVESTVICEFVDDACPGVPLRPSDPVDRAFMRVWTKRQDEELLTGMKILSPCIAFRHMDLKLPPEERRARFARLPAEVGERRAKIAELGMDYPGFAPALRRTAKLLSDMDAALADSPWLAGGLFSLADIAYAPNILRLMHLGLDGVVRERRHLHAWTERAFARPSFESAVGRWLLPDYMAVFEAHRDEARTRITQILAN